LAGLFELFTSLPTGNGNIRISEGDNVREFAWAPNPDQVNNSLAYSTERIIFTAPPNGGTSTQVTPGLTVGGRIFDFSWAPDSSRIAYRADQRVVGVIELFTVRPNGSDDLRISGLLTGGGNVTDFAWSSESSYIAYRANQDSAVIFELYVTTPDGRLSDTRVSGIPMVGGVEPFFAWSPESTRPESTRVAYRANQRTADAIELFTSTPDGQVNDRVSGELASGGNVEEFAWAPDNSGIGYIADQDINEVFELFASTPDGEESDTLSGSFAEAGDVLFFEWVP
jgi:hypothetical protein